MAQGPKKLIRSFEQEVSTFESIIDTCLEMERIYDGQSINIKTSWKGLNDAFSCAYDLDILQLDGKML